MHQRIISLAREISALVSRRAEDIQGFTNTTRLLALNAAVEASRAGQAGAGFAIVAKEVKEISNTITGSINDLQDQLNPRTRELNTLGGALMREMDKLRAIRLSDLALNMIDIIDRNLYERSCDVRWWATDAAVVDCATSHTAASAAHCATRLGIILDSYTVYLDLWVLDLNGNVIANGRPERYPSAVGSSVATSPWFTQALATKDGAEYAVADIAANPALDGRLVAAYAAAIRQGGDIDGKPIGVLAIFFDWQSQSQAVIDGIRLSPDEKPLTRALLVDHTFTIIASSDQRGVLTEKYPLPSTASGTGHHTTDAGAIVGFARTPGYETYKGLGWCGVLEQLPRQSTQQ